jgi:hypothetical protein
MNMVKRILSTGSVLLLALSMAVSLSAGSFRTGDRVYAQWLPNAWYPGKIAGDCRLGWEVLFDDGDRKCCSPHHIVLDRVPAEKELVVGARVLALWTNGKFYPGIIASVEGDRYFIQFDDGDTRRVTGEDIRLYAPPR